MQALDHLEAPDGESVLGMSACITAACVNGRVVQRPRADSVVIGVLGGEGIGPEVIGSALEVLWAVAGATGLRVDVCEGGVIGRDAERASGTALSAEVTRFCEEVFARGGAILSGPGGGRYVYDLRKQFDLFLKLSPLRIANGLLDVARVRPESLSGTDIVIARENTGGVYQGTWREGNSAQWGRVAEHHVEYSEIQVCRFLECAARLASLRRGELTVVWKEAGVPSLSRLWRDCARETADRFGVRLSMVDIDLMAYRLIQECRAFDVIAAPNLFGDILADLGSVLLGSRGLSFSGNWSSDGKAVFQTNHGAAYDLARTDRANPIGQVFSLAMMLREHFGLWIEPESIEQAVRSVWSDGWRTEDVAGEGSRIVGTSEMSSRVAQRAGEIARGYMRRTKTRSRVA